MTLTAEILQQYTAPRWMRRARCANSDPALFFPEPGDPGNAVKTNAAKRICRDCPVKALCLRWAFETEDRFAVLGGTTPYQRTRMTKNVPKRRFRTSGRFTSSAVRRKKKP